MKYTEERYSRQSSSSSQPSPLKSKGDFSHTFKKTCFKSYLESQQSSSGCEAGDFVCFYNKQGQPSLGIVKWSGTSTSTRTFECVYVGILTVSLPFPLLNCVVIFVISMYLYIVDTIHVFETLRRNLCNTFLPEYRDVSITSVENRK